MSIFMLMLLSPITPELTTNYMIKNGADDTGNDKPITLIPILG